MKEEKSGWLQFRDYMLIKGIGVEKEVVMVTFLMSKEETAVLKDVLERYYSHLEVEISRTRRREFREILKEREKNLKGIMDRLNLIEK